MQLTERQAPAANSPHLALVLGSGGVRSVAALGLADGLADAGLAPDLIVGCSSGALFGACIAMGMTGEQGLAAAMRLWSAELTEKKRWRAYFELLAPKLMGFNAGFSLRDAGLIRTRVESAFGAAKLEDLPTSLRVVTTESASGESVVLTRGSVADSVRASMALPIVFPSVFIDGRHLVDGVIADPLPVSAASDARVVVALGFRGAMPRRIDRPSRLVGQVTTALINNLQQARVASAVARGQRVINVELSLDRRIRLWETAAMPKIFDIGRRAAESYVAAIRRALDVARQDVPNTSLAAAQHR
jgi:NTE family protein